LHRSKSSRFVENHRTPGCAGLLPNLRAGELVVDAFAADAAGGSRVDGDSALDDEVLIREIAVAADRDLGAGVAATTRWP
jgi:hypothetical protein